MHDDSSKIIRSLDVLHPDLRRAVQDVQANIIAKHRMPIKLFETGRTKERHEMLMKRGLAQDPISRHRFNLEAGVFATAVSFVYYEDGRWSWNIRNVKVKRWLQLFGEMVLDRCNNVNWRGYDRERTDYTKYELVM